MNRLIGLIFVFSMVLACNHELNKPADLIPEKQMKEIIKEIYLYKQVRNYNLANDLPAAAKTNLAILNRHGVSLDQFKSSYQYYVIDHAAYDKFLEEIQLEIQSEIPVEFKNNMNEKNGQELLSSPPSS
ncbi:MAG: DUF4296 domain-containing protein [Flavobacteriaceae bacterium]|nr:DUF4296 domain-containing protein [Flavobacteriaceae bacterium]